MSGYYKKYALRNPVIATRLSTNFFDEETVNLEFRADDGRVLQKTWRAEAFDALFVEVSIENKEGAE